MLNSLFVPGGLACPSLCVLAQSRKAAVSQMHDHRAGYLSLFPEAVLLICLFRNKGEYMGFLDNLFARSNPATGRDPYISQFDIIEVTDSKGRVKKKARYKGVWTVMREADLARGKLIFALLLAILLAALDLWAVTLTHLSSGQLLVMIPLLIGLMPALYLLFGAFSLPYKGRPMRHDQYMHSFIRMSRSSVAVAVCAVMAVILSLIYRATTGNWQFFTEDILFLVLLCAVTGFALGVIFLLRSIDFAELPNDAVPYEHSIF